MNKILKVQFNGSISSWNKIWRLQPVNTLLLCVDAKKIKNCTNSESSLKSIFFKYWLIGPSLIPIIHLTYSFGLKCIVKLQSFKLKSALSEIAAVDLQIIYYSSFLVGNTLDLGVLNFLNFFFAIFGFQGNEHVV